MMSKRSLTTSLAVLGFLAMGFTPGHPAEKDGKAIFLDSKCSNCHSISSEGIKGLRPEGGAKPSDLSNVGSKFKSEWFEKWLMKEETLYNKKHMKKFKGSAEELHTLANWLETLKGEKK
ncbi:MAG: c-type cytochrome [Bacteroidota bacterium]|nr:c-type cytochrome [Bacteroidota bacterium]MDP4232448.1 c-type cytochrome [Bacteroidota bacterium]MDP4241584.1 c-type cytochrome [Bacteroidota bacterium]MDP4286328.1 c-type cytochrome [Bacteroidota bacterium]